jgi:class 3 adenylate cyclase
MDQLFHGLTAILAAVAVGPTLARAGRGVLARMRPGLPGWATRGRASRCVATVLFVDIVESTARAARIGDRRWCELLESYQALVRDELRRFNGREIDAAGDGFLAVFAAPAQAVRCARAILDGSRPLGIEVRSGLHSGECETTGEKLSGIAVHIGSRVVDSAAPGEILVSRTVRDLVVGSELEFEDRGEHRLKGVPGEWRLYASMR